MFSNHLSYSHIKLNVNDSFSWNVECLYHVPPVSNIIMDQHSAADHQPYCRASYYLCQLPNPAFLLSSSEFDIYFW